MNVRDGRIGTDSLASNPDLDILAEARFLRRHYPEVEPAAIVRMLTLNGAEALGFDAVAGSSDAGQVGRSSSCCRCRIARPYDGSARQSVDPHDLVLDSALPVAFMP